MFVDLQLVWIRDATDGFIHAVVSDARLLQFVVAPVEKKYPKRIVSADDIYPSCDGPQDLDDSCKYRFNFLHFWGFYKSRNNVNCQFSVLRSCLEFYDRLCNK